SFTEMFPQRNKVLPKNAAPCSLVIAWSSAENTFSRFALGVSKLVIRNTSPSNVVYQKSPVTSFRNKRTPNGPMSMTCSILMSGRKATGVLTGGCCCAIPLLVKPQRRTAKPKSPPQKYDLIILLVSNV